MSNLLLLAFVLIASINVFSQEALVITKQNFEITPRIDSLVELSSIVLPSVTKPKFGENINWDYSNLDLTDLSIVFNYSNKSNIPAIPDANLVFTDYFDVLAVDRGYYFDEYFTIDEIGYINVGFGFDEDQSASIGDLTGGPQDKIVFPKQYYKYNFPRTVMKFPFTYGSSDISEYKKEFDFSITIAGFGLFDSPAKKVSYISQNDSVVGWGSLVLPYIYVENGVSKPYKTLLIKRTTTKIDSLFLNGFPAPEPLLVGFGIEQGKSEVSNRLMFWRENSQTPIFSINYDASFSNLTSVTFDIRTETASSVNISDNNNQISIFPNPVNKYLNIQIPETSSNSLKVVISDLHGNLIGDYDVNKNNNIIELPTQIANGVYFISLQDIHSQFLAKGKFIVNNN